MKIEEMTTSGDQNICLGKFTLLVGSNNVGKSQTLKDIHKKIELGHEAETALISQLKVDRPSNFDELLEDLNINKNPLNPGIYTIDGLTSSSIVNSVLTFDLDGIRNEFEREANADFIFRGFGKFRAFYLSAESRLSIASMCQNFIPGESAPKTLLQAFFGSLGKFDKLLEDAFRSTFGMNIKLDYSSCVNLRFAVNHVFELVPEDPRSAYPIMKKYPSLEDQGDGFRSFVAVVLSLLLSQNKVVLLDEPEAFLHPEQARRLGQWMSDHIDSFPCQVIVATHNANFLTGLLSGKQPADIYRLNRVENITRFNKITADATQKLSRSPILSSQRVLESIFSRGVVVCEAESDRVIYQSVAVHEHKNQELLFIHAHNKQAIKDVIQLLIDASIPRAAIVDIDILNSKSDLENLLISFDMNEECLNEILLLRDEISNYIEEKTEEEILLEIQAGVEEFIDQLLDGNHNLAGAKSALKRIFKESTKWKKIKDEGVVSFSFLYRQKVERIIEICKTVGLFIVPVGELEGWLKLEVKKNRWVIPALEKIIQGKCPADLVDFINGVIKHVYTVNL